MSGIQDAAADSSGATIFLGANGDVVSLLANLLSNQYFFFTSVSKEWRDA